MQRKDQIEEIKRNRDLSLSEDIAWIKAVSAETARLNKRKADKLREQEDMMSGFNDEDSLFLAESTPPRNDIEERSFTGTHFSWDNDSGYGDHMDPNGPGYIYIFPNDNNMLLTSAFSEGSSSGRRRQASIPRKTPKPDRLKGSMESMLVGFKAFENDGPKKKRQMLEAAQAALPKGRGRAKGKAKSAGNTSNSKKGRVGAKAGGKVAKKAKPAKYTGPSMTDIGSLFTSNVFTDQEGNQDRSDQPTFDKGRKDQALKQLIASVPLEHQKSARADRKVLLAATKDFTGHGSCKPDNDGKWLVRGMKTSLKSYQLLGSAFMRRRETAAEEPRGGLVADQMGLGKTVMMLANIINGKPPKDKKDGRATLIVASPALVEQWKEEIKVHCHPWAHGAIMTWRAGSRIDSTEALKVMDSHEIILTTYTDVMKSYPKTEPPIEITDPEDKQVWWMNEWEEKRGPLHRMRFLRVVLDEAQAIKNHTGRTSIACRGLMADSTLR